MAFPFCFSLFSLWGFPFYFRGWQSGQPFQSASLCPTAITFLAPAGANPAGSIDSYLASPLDFQFFGAT